MIDWGIRGRRRLHLDGGAMAGPCWRLGFDVTGHHNAREDYGEQEELEETSIDGSGEAMTAR